MSNYGFGSEYGVPFSMTDKGKAASASFEALVEHYRTYDGSTVYSNGDFRAEVDAVSLTVVDGYGNFLLSLDKLPAMATAELGAYVEAELN